MDFLGTDTFLIVVGFLATFLFAECIILIIKGHSMKNKMEAQIDGIRNDEKLRYEKKQAQLELSLKEQEIELKSEYEDLLNAAKGARREIDERLEDLRAQKASSAKAQEISDAEYARYSKLKEEYRARAKEYANKLISLTNLSAESMRDEAKKEILKKCDEDLLEYREEIFKARKSEIDDEARRMLADSMQKTCSKYAHEITTCIVKIPDEAMKGRLIGKDGRNIRSFEAGTGTTLLIDETPGSVMISCFEPVRRETAKIALETLVADGRINPSSIEEAIASAQEEVFKNASKWGEDAAAELGLSKVHPEILGLLGKLNLHLSLNQNSLSHSIETAKHCALIATELGCDAEIAKRVGLFHDIGKVYSENQELSHALAAAKILEACGESPPVVNAVGAHHGEIEKNGIYATIVQIADSVSSSRPGARMDSSDGYIQRMKSLEEIARGFEGVSNAYAIQAGRELRVIVSPEVLNEVETAELLAKIRSEIEKSVNSSVPIKITVIREQRFSANTGA